MRRTFAMALVPLFVFVLAFGLAACSQPDNAADQDQGTIEDDPNPAPNPLGDDDSGDDDAADDDAADDDATDDDVSPPLGNITIHKPEPGDAILGNQVPVQIEFAGNPDNPAVSLDDGSVNIADWTWEPPMLFGTINSVPEGGHHLVASALYNEGFDQASVDFSTTLEGFTGWIELNVSQTSIPVGGAVVATWSVYDDHGDDITDETDVTLTTDPTVGAVIDGNTITFNVAGGYWVIAAAELDGVTVSDQKRIAVDTGGASDVASVEIDCTPKNIHAGEVVTCVGHAYDEDGAQIAHAILYSLNPANAGTVEANEITLTLAGQTVITGTAWGTAISDTNRVTVEPGGAETVALTLDPSAVEVEQTSVAAVNVVDEFGNPIEEVDVVTLRAQPSDGVTIAGMNITPHISANIVITARATYNGSQVESQAILSVTDPYPPNIDITSPERGSLITDTNNINVTGTVWDEHGSIESFTINGQAVSFDALGRFTKNVTLLNGLNTMVFTAEDNSGNSTNATVSVMFAPTFLPNGNGISKAIGAHVNQTGLNTIAEIAEEYIVEAIDEQLAGMFPYEIFHETYDLWGFDIFEGLAELTTVTLDPVQVTLTPINGGLHIVAHVTNIQATGFLYYDFFDKDSGEKFGATEDFTVTMPWADVTADLWISANLGDLSVTMANTSVSMSSIDIDIDGTIFGDLFGWLLEELVNAFAINIVEDLIRDTIDTIVPPLIWLALRGLDLNFDLELFGFEYHLSADFSEVTFDSDGGDLWLHAFLRYGNGNWAPGPHVPDLPGSILTDNGQPSFGPYVPGTSTPYEFGVALGDDILNQFFHAIHRSGLLSLDLDEETLEQFGITGFELTTGALGVFFPGLWSVYGFDEPVIIKMRPMFPPVFTFYTDDKTGAVSAEIQLGDFVLALSSQGENWATLALAIYFPVEVTISDEQTISLEFGDLEMYSDLFQVKDGVRANESLFEDFLPMLVEALVPMLLRGALEDFPIPSFEGFTVNVNSFKKVGPGSDWMGLYGDLVQIPGVKLDLQSLDAQMALAPEKPLRPVRP